LKCLYVPVVCLCVEAIDYASFHNFSIELWNCSDSVVFFIILLNHYKKIVAAKHTANRNFFYFTHAEFGSKFAYWVFCSPPFDNIKLAFQLFVIQHKWRKQNPLFFLYRIACDTPGNWTVMYLCVRVSITLLSTIFLLFCVHVPTLWYFLFFILCCCIYAYLIHYVHTGIFNVYYYYQVVKHCWWNVQSPIR
jgi:hypothetical protein